MDEILKTANYVKGELQGEGSGHDWWHIYRVWQLAKHIGEAEGADLRITELGALLHDIADWKFHGTLEAGPRKTREWLTGINVDAVTIDEVCGIVRDISYKGAGVATPMKTLAGMCVQDADRLEALGAIGIGRAFAYGGYKQREMHNPTIPAQLHQDFEQYKSSNGTTINHFYEKLLLLKDRMNTETGRRIALERHEYMEKFLEQFYAEWEGKR